MKDATIDFDPVLLPSLADASVRTSVTCGHLSSLEYTLILKGSDRRQGPTGECSSRWATTEMATKKAKICCAFPCVKTYPSLGGITSASIVKRWHQWIVFHEKRYFVVRGPNDLHDLPASLMKDELAKIPTCSIKCDHLGVPHTNHSLMCDLGNPCAAG